MSIHSSPPGIPGEPSIDFSSAEIEFELDNIANIKDWLEKIIEQEECSLRLLNFIFCSDKYLHRLNVEYLSHDTLTDVITFPYAAPPIVEGDIFISIDRIKDNAKTYGVAELQELFRVMAHGVLHLCGYGDKTADEAKLMHSKENGALILLDEIIGADKN